MGLERLRCHPLFRSNSAHCSLSLVLLVWVLEKKFAFSFVPPINVASKNIECNPFRRVDVRTHWRYFPLQSRRKRSISADDDNEEEEEDPVYNDDLIYSFPAKFDLRSSDISPKPKTHNNCSNFDAGYNILLKRIGLLRVQSSVESQLSRPPSSYLDTIGFVEALLSALRVPDDPLPDSGIGTLFHSSTWRWRALLRECIGAPRDAEARVVCRALGNAISREGNQFGILVGSDDSEDYVTSFPSEVVDLNDGKSWVECQLRAAGSDRLLVSMGWRLKRRSMDGAWLIDGIDWHEYRDSYRPGIGREEWVRSLG